MRSPWRTTSLPRVSAITPPKDQTALQKRSGCSIDQRWSAAKSVQRTPWSRSSARMNAVARLRSIRSAEGCQRGAVIGRRG